MSTLVIEHLKASDLPQQWVHRLKVQPEQTVTVRIKTEAAQPASHTPEPFITDDPAFGMWRDREEMADVPAYLRHLRTPRYATDGSSQGDDAVCWWIPMY